MYCPLAMCRKPRNFSSCGAQCDVCTGVDVFHPNRSEMMFVLVDRNSFSNPSAKLFSSAVSFIWCFTCFVVGVIIDWLPAFRHANAFIYVLHLVTVSIFLISTKYIILGWKISTTTSPDFWSHMKQRRLYNLSCSIIFGFQCIGHFVLYYPHRHRSNTVGGRHFSFQSRSLLIPRSGNIHWTGSSVRWSRWPLRSWSSSSVLMLLSTLSTSLPLGPPKVAYMRLWWQPLVQVFSFMHLPLGLPTPWSTQAIHQTFRTTYHGLDIGVRANTVVGRHFRLWCYRSFTK